MELRARLGRVRKPCLGKGEKEAKSQRQSGGQVPDVEFFARHPGPKTCRSEGEDQNFES
jgi:hypothetical protein